MEALDAASYDGWLSHEIFNDRFCMASPRHIALDGQRSLINLLGRTKKAPCPPPLRPRASPLSKSRCLGKTPKGWPPCSAPWALR